MTQLETYLANERHRQHLLQLTLAVHAGMPKKYRDQLTTLFKSHPEVIETHQLTLASTELRLLWRCPVAELPRLLDLMTRRSHSRMTYQTEPGPPGLGDTIHLTFTVPVDAQGGPRDGRES